MSTDRPIDRVLSLLQNRGLRPSGDTGRQWECHCPAHEDRSASLYVARGDGEIVLVKCFAGCTAAQIVAAIGLELKNLFPAGQKPKRPPGITVNELAFDKRLPAAWLRETCKLADGNWWERGVDHRAVKIPYLGADGTELFQRTRFALSAKTGTRQPKGTALQLYGLWLLDTFRARGGPLVVVEGESDCWSLWLNEVNALGVPGADTAKTFAAVDPAVFAGFDRVCIWQEPDRAGAGFPDAVGRKLESIGFTGRVEVVSLTGAKDPADLYVRDPAGFRDRWVQVLAAARPWSPSPESSPATAVLPASVRRVETIIRAAGVPEWGEFEFTDLGNAGRLAKVHGPDLRYVATWDKWMVWDGRRWRVDATLEVSRRAERTVWGIALEAQAAPGRHAFDECMAFLRRSQSAQSISAMVRLARSVAPVPVDHSEFDADTWSLNCVNGTVDLRTGELRQHRREDLCTTICPTVFDPTARCPAWERFLAGIFPADPDDPDAGGNTELIGFVRRLLGYSLTGEVDAQVLPIFWGDGSNGKSTLLDTIQEVIGEDFVTPAPEGFLMEQFNDRHPTEIADLRGKRLVIASETEERRRLNEALVKKLTGGDKLKARFMRQDNFSFRPTHKIILLTNHKPRVRGTDHGIKRRLMLVPFAVRFWNPAKNETGPDHLRRDDGLKKRLLAEAPGILAWLVRGCLEWQRDGLGEPPDVASATAEYLHDEDQVGQFIDARYGRTSDNWSVLLKDIWDDYVKWCEQESERPVLRTSRHLASDLRARGFEVKPGKGKQVKVYGLEPVETAAFDADEL